MESRPAPASGRLLRNTFHLGVGQVATTCLAMLLSAAVARTLGAADFGLLYLLTSIAGFAYVFVDWGHGPYVTREVAINPHRAGDLVGSVLAVRVGTTAFVCVITVVVMSALGYDVRARILAALLILAWLPQYLGLSFGWIFRGSERMEYDALLQVILKSSVLVLALATLTFGGRLVALLPVFLGAGAITLASALLLYRRLGFPPIRVSRDTMRELVRDGAPLMAISLAVAVQPYIDANILYALVPKPVMGWYAAMWTIASTLVAPASILGSAMYPQLSRAATDAAAFARALRSAFRPLLLVAVLGAVGTYLFADVAIGVVYGEQTFGPAAQILRAFAPALLLIYLNMVFGFAIVASGKAGQFAKAKILAIIVTTSLEWVFISWFQAGFSNGGIGIVLAIAGGELVMLAAALFLLRDVIDGGMFVDFLRAVGAGAATIFIMRAVPPLHPAMAIPLCVFTFGAASVLVGLITRGDMERLVLSRARRLRTDASVQV